MPKRINEIATTTTSAAADDYVALDGVTNNTRKILAANLGGAGTEGTWTPGIEFGGASTGITYTTQNGYYLKVGTWVFILFNISLSSKGSASGNCTITGLPFAAAVSYGGIYATYFGLFSSLTSLLFGRINGSDDFLYLTDGSSATSTAITDSNFGNTSYMRMAGMYLTS